LPAYSTSPRREPLVSVLRKGFHFEVFRDLHEHLYQRFQRPSLVVTTTENGDLKTCFPRKRIPLPDELYHHLIAATVSMGHESLIDREKLSKVSELLGATQPKWGWYETSPGLVDLYLPVHAPGLESADDGCLIGVLVLGRFKSSSPGAGQSIHNWLDALDVPLQDSRSSKQKDDKTQSYREFLHSLVDELPILTSKLQAKIQYEASRSISLLERFTVRMVSAETLFGEEGLIAHLGLDEPAPSISFNEVWRQSTEALQRIVSFLSLTNASLYSSPDRDYSELELRAYAPASTEVADTLALATLDEFTWLQGENWLNLPGPSSSFAWLKPLTFFNASNAMLFGRSTVGGHLILLAFGFDEANHLSPSQRTALYDAVNSRIFPFLHSALSAIELDNLMAETGHLLGRAIAKVTTGTRSLQALSPGRPAVAPEHQKEYGVARWAVTDGLTRLDLIRHNFYSFPASRRTVSGLDERLDADGEIREIVDVVRVLHDMRDYFRRAVRESPLRAVKFRVIAKELRTKGNRNAMRMTLLNLFDNALKFSYANTFLVISAREKKRNAVLEIENLGIGVAPDEGRYVFRRLARSRYRDPHRRIEGLGLGLSYCRRVVEEIFQGRITLESRQAPTPHPLRFEGDNWLTTVTIEIPIVQEEELKSNE